MDDLEFVQRCSKGDELAWNEFVDRYSRLIYSYIHAILRIKGSHLAQENINDLFQEVFLLLAKDNFKKLKTFRGKNGCSLASWLRQVVINYTIDYSRRINLDVSLDAEDEDEMSLKEILASDLPSVTDTLSQNEKLTHLKDCITDLSQDDKYFLELHLNQGLTLEELKSRFKVSRGAIDMRKRRIIERLRECFKSKGFQLDF